MEKRKLIIYWITTGLVAFGMLGSGIQQIARTQQMVDMITPLGYPLYFITLLGIWKILAVLAILVPRFGLIKEWAYAGLFFTMTGALVSHIAIGDTGIKEIWGQSCRPFSLCYLGTSDRQTEK